MPPALESASKTRPDVSVIIPFRNRDLKRLSCAIASLRQAAVPSSLEIIVSDFGSDNEYDVAQLCEQQDVTLVRTEADHWSRSACLNRGIERATGDFIQCDDADMIWTPGSLGRHVQSLMASPGAFVNYQVWDLPPTLTDDLLTGQAPDWDALREVAQAHSRWGHGLILAPKQAFLHVGGFDERMHTYGLEDLDLTKRMRLAGWRQQWAGNDGDELFHIWHPRVPDTVKKDPVIAEIINANRELYYEDDSVIRNRKDSIGRGTPLVSVVIATRDRKNHLLEAIDSCLYQTVQNIEVIVVDDGSTDGTGDMIRGMTDPRIRYEWQDPQGISAARNRGTDMAIGPYIAVLDDDDLMVPDRLEIQLGHLTGQVRGCVGNILNFDDLTGELETWGDPSPDLQNALGFGGFAAHPSWLVERSLLEDIPYDESLTSAVDNNVALRALRAGIQFSHCERIVTLRRRHALQVTQTDSGNQKIGARLTHLWYRAAVSESVRRTAQDEVPSNVKRARKDDANISQPESWLPDHLVERTVEIKADRKIWESELLPAEVKKRYFLILDQEGSLVGDPPVLHGATWKRLLDLRNKGIEHRVASTRIKGLTSMAAKENVAPEPVGSQNMSNGHSEHSSDSMWTAFHDAVDSKVQDVRRQLNDTEFLAVWLSSFEGTEQATSFECSNEFPTMAYSVIGSSLEVRLNMRVLGSASDVKNLITNLPGLTKVYMRRAPISLKSLQDLVANEARKGAEVR